MSNPLDKLNRLKGESAKKDLTETVKSKNIPSAEKGVREGYRRFTYIANKEQLEKAKALAWYQRIEMKDVIEQALEAHFNQSKDIDKAIKEFAQKGKK